MSASLLTTSLPASRAHASRKKRQRRRLSGPGPFLPDGPRGTARHRRDNEHAHAIDSPEVLRVRCEWDRFERGDAIPCLDSDAEIVNLYFEPWFQDAGAEFLRDHTGGDLIVEYARFVEVLGELVGDIGPCLANTPDKVLRQLGVAADLVLKEFLPRDQKRPLRQF